MSRGVGVISREAPAFRKADRDPPHFTAEGIQALVQEVRCVEGATLGLIACLL